jgi:hypothetical protein
MRLPTLLAGIVSFALAVSAHAADPTTVAHSRGPGYDLYRSGPAGTVSKSTPRGGVLMMGGGEYFPQAFEWLFDRGGHGRLVVLRASGEGDLNPYFMDELGGVAAVDTLVFSGREASSDPTVLAVVKAADMIFIGGGATEGFVGRNMRIDGVLHGRTAPEVDVVGLVTTANEDHVGGFDHRQHGRVAAGLAA